MVPEMISRVIEQEEIAPPPSLDIKDAAGFNNLIFRSERFAGAAKLLPAIVVLLQFWFVVLEMREGVSYDDIPEVLLLMTCLWLMALYWRASNLNLKSLVNSNIGLLRQASVSIEESNKWKKEAQEALQSLSNKINKQFTAWSLTSAEKEVALGLLKGLSHKEVAVLRNSSEKTVRIQAAAVYRKTNLDGRAQLSAFFLQGLTISSVVTDK